MAGDENPRHLHLIRVGLTWRHLAAAVLLLVLPQGVQAHGGHGHDSITETELRIALEVNPQDLGSRNRLGAILVRKKKLTEAEREFAAVLKQAPRDQDAHDGMGLVRLQERKYPEAATWFNRAIALKSEETLPHFHLGQTYEQMGQPVEARHSYEQALAVNRRLLRQGEHREVEQERRHLVLAALKKLNGQQKGRKP